MRNGLLRCSLEWLPAIVSGNGTLVFEFWTHASCGVPLHFISLFSYPSFCFLWKLLWGSPKDVNTLSLNSICSLNLGACAGKNVALSLMASALHVRRVDMMNTYSERSLVKTYGGKLLCQLFRRSLLHSRSNPVFFPFDQCTWSNKPCIFFKFHLITKLVALREHLRSRVTLFFFF